MGIVSTERGGSRKQNNVTDAAFGRYSSSHIYPFRYPEGLRNISVLTFTPFSRGIQKTFWRYSRRYQKTSIFTFISLSSSNPTIWWGLPNSNGLFHWYCFGLRFLWSQCSWCSLWYPQRACPQQIWSDYICCLMEYYDQVPSMTSTRLGNLGPAMAKLELHFLLNLSR